MSYLGNAAETPPDYDPSTPGEIARADALDEIDLAAGRDWYGHAPDDDAPTSAPPGALKIADLERRARLGLALFRPGDAELGAEPPVRPAPAWAALPRRPRPRRPSELERSGVYRMRDAERKRAARAALKETRRAA